MSSSMARVVIATNSVLMILSALSVILRIYARKHQESPLGADDYLVVAAWV